MKKSDQDGIEELTDRMQLMRRYDWSLMDPVRPPKIVSHLAWTVDNLWVRIEKR